MLNKRPKISTHAVSKQTFNNASVMHQYYAVRLPTHRFTCKKKLEVSKKNLLQQSSKAVWDPDLF